MVLSKVKKISIVAVSIIIVVALYSAPIIDRLWFALNMANHDSIASNLRNLESKFPMRTIAKSSASKPLKVHGTPYSLPEFFESHGEKILTGQFLEDANYTGLIVLKDGKVLYENYWNGLTADKRQYSFSVTKSITSALIGAAIDDGLIESVNDPITKYLPNFKGSAWDKATIANSLEMSSGVDFDEDYSRQDTDMRKFQFGLALGKPVEPALLALNSSHIPGARQGYNSMEAQLAGFVLRAVLKDKTISEYMHEKIWNPLGAEDDALWMVGSDGVEITMGGLSLTLRDLAKFGQLFLNRGQWNGQQVVSEAWILDSTTPVKAYQMPGRNNPLSDKPFGYGYLWWTPVKPVGREFYASGIYGQYLFVNEEKNIVVATFSANSQFPNAPDWWKERYEHLFQSIAQQF